MGMWWKRIVRVLSVAAQAMEDRFVSLNMSVPSGERIRLLLIDDSGAHWTVDMSPGIERFIGCYPRLEAFVGNDRTLHYEIA